MHSGGQRGLQAIRRSEHFGVAASGKVQLERQLGDESPLHCRQSRLPSFDATGPHEPASVRKVLPVWLLALLTTALVSTVGLQRKHPVTGEF